MAERNFTRTGLRFGSVRHRLRILGLGLLTGVVAGMGSFMYAMSHLVPWGLDPAWMLVLVGAAGTYTHFLASDLYDSISISLVALPIGLAFHVVVWIAPLWILAYPPFVRDLILLQLLGDAFGGAIMSIFMTFYGAYCGVVIIDGYLNS